MAATWLTGAHTKQISAPPSASATDAHALVDRASLERPLERARIGVPPGHDRALGAPPRGQADRASDQAHAEDGDPGHEVPGIVVQSADSSFPTVSATRCTCST